MSSTLLNAPSTTYRTLLYHAYLKGTHPQLRLSVLAPVYLPRRPTRLLVVWVVALSTTDVSTRRLSPVIKLTGIQSLHRFGSDCLYVRGFRVYFTPLTGVLFAFPSRY
ncbi:unnamed protein product [Laminaria digitata]